MPTTEAGLSRRIFTMVALTFLRTSDAVSLLFVATIPLFTLVLLVGSMPVAGLTVAAMAGLAADLGAEVARDGFGDAYDPDDTNQSSLLAFAVYANLTFALATGAGLTVLNTSVVAAVIVASVLPVIERALMNVAWWASPSSLLVEVCWRLGGHRGVLAETFRSPLIAKLDIESLLRGSPPS